MRPEKESIVKEIADAVSGSEYLLLADFSGMKVKHFTLLRERLPRRLTPAAGCEEQYLGVVLGEERRAVAR
jgi:hypothetical protein